MARSVNPVPRPRVTLLHELRDAQWPVPTSLREDNRSREAARREAQWPTWQMDRSWPDRSVVHTEIEDADNDEDRHSKFPWVLWAASFLALAVVGAGLLMVGIEVGLL